MISIKSAPHIYLGISALILACASSTALRALESPWAASHEAKARLVAESHKLAFIEIELAPGWKTYWRTPGDAGGLPPEFDWSHSVNLASATVLYPAPSRFTDKSGTTIGYAGGVMFPVEVKAKDDQKPVSLKLSMQYGVCKEICIPVEAKLELDLAPGENGPLSQSALDALASVPRAEERRKAGDPVLVATKADLESAAPHITLDVKFSEGSDQGDVFLEAPDGLYVPLPVKTADRGDGVVTFEADLSDGADAGALKGKTITATLVSPEGASVATFPLQ